MIDLIPKAKSTTLTNEKLKAWLTENSEKYTLKELDEKLNATKNRIQYCLKTNNLKWKRVKKMGLSRKLETYEWNLLIEDRRNHMSFRDISTKYGITQSYAREYLAVRNIRPKFDKCPYCGCKAKLDESE